jgi:hypothetical protein
MPTAVDGSNNPIVITMPFTLDVSGGLAELFGLSAEVLTAYILDASNVNVQGFFKADNSDSLIKYRQPSGDADDIECSNNVAGRATALATSLQTALTTTLSVSSTFPSKEQYSLQASTPSSLGEFVVEWIAHNIFGHAQATAAISNDTAIMARINAAGDAENASAAVDAEPSGKVALRLVQSLWNLPESDLQNIVEQVLEQDPTRFRVEDNKEQATDAAWKPLEFYDGDVVYFKINLRGFSFAMKRAVAQGAPALSNQVPSLAIDDQVMFVKCTLRNPQ